jgi:hypothetical protein
MNLVLNNNSNQIIDEKEVIVFSGISLKQTQFEVSLNHLKMTARFLFW